MENFIVSARKYRPATFDTVVGQSHITTTLKNAIANNHLAQAFLFCGPRGVGKTTCARILAKTINCQNLTADHEACNTCESCVSFNNSSSFNVHELDAASNNSVDDIRSLVEQVRYAPQSGKYKIYIIDEVHMLSNAAFNAFLKTLEEPPSYAIFILATTEKHKIIPTILSRCQIFDFNRIQLNDISGHLASIAQKENIEADPEALRLIAQKADGGLRDALSIFDLINTFSAGQGITYAQVIENLHILDYDYYFKVTDYLLQEDLPKAMLIFDEILRKGFDGHNFIVGLSEHLRNLMVCKDKETIKLMQVSENVQRKYLEQAQNTSVSFLLTALNLASQCDIQYKSSKNQRLLVELALMKMCYINAAVQLAQNGGGTAGEKKKPDVNLVTSPQNNANGNGTVVGSPIVPPPSLKSTPKISEIKVPQAPTQTAPQSVTTPATVVNEPQPINVNKPFSLEQLTAKWNAFAELKRLSNQTAQAAILADKDLTIDNGSVIQVALNNFIEEEQFQSFKGELLQFLRQQLDNSSLQIVTIIAQQTNKKLLYSAQDRYNHLAEKHPIITELRQRFEMDIEM